MSSLFVHSLYKFNGYQIQKTVLRGGAFVNSASQVGSHPIGQIRAWAQFLIISPNPPNPESREIFGERVHKSPTLAIRNRQKFPSHERITWITVGRGTKVIMCHII
jgi:hypothetical protein